MKKFICVQKCLELDCDNSLHCIDTEEGIRDMEERCHDYCPCGGEAIWEEISE